MTSDIVLPSIRDRDLKAVFTAFGLFDALEAGSLICASCSRPITWENVGAIRVVRGSLAIYCDFSECLASSPPAKDQ